MGGPRPLNHPNVGFFVRLSLAKNVSIENLLFGLSSLNRYYFNLNNIYISENGIYVLQSMLNVTAGAPICMAKLFQMSTTIKQSLMSVFC